MQRRKRIGLYAAALLLLTLLLSLSTARAEVAAELEAQCAYRSDARAWKFPRMTDGDYDTYWQSGEQRNPWLIIQSEEPMHGLYLCLREMPESYELQRREGDEWVTFAQGDTRFHHVYYALNGETEIRLYSTQQRKHCLRINELSVLGAGETPAWVQRWEETEAKADILLLVAHPDDDLIFFAGTIPTYAVERETRFVIAYLTYCDKTRRSETLNALWSMGVRRYPVFGPFPDKYSRSLKEAYQEAVGGSVNAGKKKVRHWLTELLRIHQPEVVLSQDVKGEYGHGQHRMVADVAIDCFELAADPTYHPDSAAQHGVWAVKKLYLHLYGDETNQLRLTWDTPLSSQNGRTGMQAAEEAFTFHKSQTGLIYDVAGKRVPLSVEEFGSYYDNTLFGLYATRVGPDVQKNDFLENIDGQTPTMP